MHVVVAQCRVLDEGEHGQFAGKAFCDAVHGVNAADRMHRTAVMRRWHVVGTHDRQCVRRQEFMARNTVSQLGNGLFDDIVRVRLLDESNEIFYFRTKLDPLQHGYPLQNPMG